MERKERETGGESQVRKRSRKRKETDRRDGERREEAKAGKGR